MRHLAILALSLVIGTSVGCCCLSKGCGPCNSGGYGTYYGGGSSCPGGNCGLQGAYNDGGYGGLQSASIPGAYPVTASAPIIMQPTATAAAPAPGTY